MSEEKPTTEQLPMPVPAGGLTFRPLASIANGKVDPNMWSTNFSGQGPQAAAFITQALAKEGQDIRTVGDKVFPTKYYLAHVAEFIAEDGEVVPMPRVILIGPSGETMPFVSEGAIRSLDLIRTLCGDGPWEPPLNISVVPVKTRRGFFTYRLVLGGIGYGSVEEKVSGKRDKRTAQGSDSQV